MFRSLGHWIARGWWLVLLLWVAATVALSFLAPPVESVTIPGEFNFLPDSAPTRRGEELFKKAFPHDLLGSSVVIVVERQGEPLTEADLAFIDDTLKPQLQSLMPRDTGTDSEVEQNTEEQDELKEAAREEHAETFPEIHRIRTPGSKEIGKLMVSDDRKAALVIVDLSGDFMSYQIRHPVHAIQETVANLKDVPKGLEFYYSGSAVVGRDLGTAQKNSAEAVQRWTLILIVGLLLLVYRAPLPVLVPLLTLWVSLHIALRLLAAASLAGWVELFEGIQVYTVVVAYGAGVDFSMFLTSRFHEEIQRHDSVSKALVRTMEGVGPAVLAAACTVIFGIGMMIFATFGKFHQAGISIAFSLFVILCAALTFTPSILCLMGRYTFWPEMPSHGVDFRTQQVGLLSRFMRRVTLHEQSHRGWERLAHFVTHYPVRSWLVTAGCMLPFVFVGWWSYEHISFGLIGQLRSSAASVQGTEQIAHHFSMGRTGPATILISQPDVDFGSSAGKKLIEDLNTQLKSHAEELHVTDVLSEVEPLGWHRELDTAPQRASVFNRIIRRNAQRTGSREYYIGSRDESGAHATRLDVIMDADPFSLEAIAKLDRLEKQLRTMLPEELRESQAYVIGPTASIRDLQSVASIDRVRINVLVTLAVFVVLVMLIRSLPDSIYLMATVIFSFLCTLGIAWLVFYSLDPKGFQGLDWTVPTFLFTILVAVGQDYNIFLVTRVHEEHEHHGPIGSVKHAVIQTAAIITSCGLIMAGTFSAMVVGGELARMTQLGFSLSCGVLIDTLLVRAVLVPTYLAWRARRQVHKLHPAAHGPVESISTAAP
jgi:RND superfamily putative drug exporter